jgi:glycosyltransferase involved in cell wall biosynthesis
VSPVDPRVSIGIPVYNGADTLAAALDSLLAQTFADFEVIIADNASTDGTPAICQDYAARDPRIHYHRNAENLGAAGNFNRVLELARGAYFKWFAHDDLLAPQYLERCLRAFDESDESFVLVHPGRRVMAHDGTLLERDPYLISGRAEDESSYDDLSFPRLMTVCGSRCPIFVFGLMRTEVVRRTRGMGNYIAADLVFVAEMRLRGRFRAVAGDLFFQRLHAPTPDVLARTRHGGDVAWFDPRRRRRWVFPETRLLGEMSRAIRGAPIPLLDKLRDHVALGLHVRTRAHRWCVLAGRRWRGRGWRLWSGLSRGLIRAEGVTTLPLRMWIFASGLRGRDGRRCRLAWSGPWGRAHPALLTFAAGKLAERDDPRAAEILVDWLLGPFPVRQEVAARALATRSATHAGAVADGLRARGITADRLVERIAEWADAEATSAWRDALADALPAATNNHATTRATVARVAG